MSVIGKLLYYSNGGKTSQLLNPTIFRPMNCFQGVDPFGQTLTPED